MSQEIQLKKALKDSYCYLEVMLKKYEILKNEREKDYQFFIKKYDDFKDAVGEARMANKDLTLKNENLECELAKFHKKLEDLNDSSMGKQKALEQGLIRRDKEINSLRQQNNLLQIQLKDLEENLSITKFQAETFMNDFKLERESREKLNDEKLRLEDELEDARKVVQGTFNFHVNDEEPLTATDDWRTNNPSVW